MTLEEIVSVKYDLLNESDLYIWKCISNSKAECAKLNIEELGKKCNVSRTTILRFAKKLDLEGFSELRYYLRNEAALSPTGEGTLIDLDVMLKNYTVMLGDLKNKNFNGACELIENARRIIVVGTGNVQWLIAQEMQRSFLRMGIFMTVINGKTEIENVHKWMTQEDLAILISFSGENPGILSIGKKLKSNGVPIISITRLSSNSLARLADQPIYVYSDGVSVAGTEYYMSITMFFSVIEVLFIKYYNYIQQKHLTESDREIL